MDSLEGRQRAVRVVDVPRQRVRRPVDLMQMILSLLGIGVMIALSVYARGTTSGVTDDVQSALSSFVRSVVLVPVSFIEAFLVIVLPAVVLTERLIRKKFQDVVAAVVAAGVAYLAAAGAGFLIETFGATRLLLALRIWREGELLISILPLVTALAALLTVTGTRSANRAVSISWTLLWIALAVSVVTGDGTINGALITVLLGRAVGLMVRYATGIVAERIHGAELVAAIARAGAEPRPIVRLGEHDGLVQPEVPAPSQPGHSPFTFDEDPSRGGASEGGSEGAHGFVPTASAERHAPVSAHAARTSPQAGAATAEDRPAGATAHGPSPGAGNGTSTGAAMGAAEEAAHGAPGRSGEGEPKRKRAASKRLSATGVLDILAATPEPASVVVEREGWNRVYAVETTAGERLDAIVLDEDRQVIGLLSQLWTALRLRGVGRRSATNLRQAAERAALMTYAARAAGVNTPSLHGVADGPGSIVLLGEHIDNATALINLPDESITDEVIVAAFRELTTAHEAGLSHRNLTGENVLVAPHNEV